MTWSTKARSSMENLHSSVRLSRWMQFSRDVMSQIEKSITVRYKRFIWETSQMNSPQSFISMMQLRLSRCSWSHFWCRTDARGDALTVLHRLLSKKLLFSFKFWIFFSFVSETFFNEANEKRKKILKQKVIEGAGIAHKLFHSRGISMHETLSQLKIAIRAIRVFFNKQSAC